MAILSTSQNTRYGCLSRSIGRVSWRQLVIIGFTASDLQKTSKNHLKRSVSEFSHVWTFLDVFFKTDALNPIMTSQRQLTCQILLDRHPYWVFCKKVRFQIFNGLVRFSPNLWGVKTDTKPKKENFYLLYMHQTPDSQGRVLIG